MKILVLVISGGECPIYNKNKDIFELFPSNEWFTLFSRHLNKND